MVDPSRRLREMPYRSVVREASTPRPCRRCSSPRRLPRHQQLHVLNTRRRARRRVLLHRSRDGRRLHHHVAGLCYERARTETLPERRATRSFPRRLPARRRQAWPIISQGSSQTSCRHRNTTAHQGATRAYGVRLAAPLHLRAQATPDLKDLMKYRLWTNMARNYEKCAIARGGWCMRSERSPHHTVQLRGGGLVALKGVRTEGAMAPEIDKHQRRPKVFSRNVANGSTNSADHAQSQELPRPSTRSCARFAGERDSGRSASPARCSPAPAVIDSTVGRSAFATMPGGCAPPVRDNSKRRDIIRAPREGASECDSCRRGAPFSRLSAALAAALSTAHPSAMSARFSRSRRATARRRATPPVPHDRPAFAAGDDAVGDNESPASAGSSRRRSQRGGPRGNLRVMARMWRRRSGSPPENGHQAVAAPWLSSHPRDAKPGSRSGGD